MYERKLQQLTNMHESDSCAFGASADFSPSLVKLKHTNKRHHQCFNQHTDPAIVSNQARTVQHRQESCLSHYELVPRGEVAAVEAYGVLPRRVGRLRRRQRDLQLVEIAIRLAKRVHRQRLPIKRVT